eukprot:237508-Rhodomonas_salina.2
MGYGPTRVQMPAQVYIYSRRGVGFRSLLGVEGELCDGDRTVLTQVRKQLKLHRVAVRRRIYLFGSASLTRSPA